MQKGDFSTRAPDDKPERQESLWWLAASPTIWAAHFLTSYITVALWCAKVAVRDGGLGPARSAVFVYTLIALIAIAAVAVRAYRRHTYGTATVPHDFDTRADRHRFLGFATLLLSGLSGVGVFYVVLPAFYMGTCR